MFNSVSGMSLTVDGGSAEENNQLCTVLASVLRNNGFRNVQLEAHCEVQTGAVHDHDTVSAMRRLNPDLFDTPITVTGESEDDMRANMAALGFGGQPFAYQPAAVGFF
jgi:hypothetical protein